MEIPPKFAYSISEAAKLIGVSQSTIRRNIDNGELKAVKWGRRTVIRHADLFDRLNSLPTLEVK